MKISPVLVSSINENVKFKGKNKSDNAFSFGMQSQFAPKNLSLYSFLPKQNISFKGEIKSDEPKKLKDRFNEYGCDFEFGYDIGDEFVPYIPYAEQTGEFDAKKFLDDIRYENADKKYIVRSKKMGYWAETSMEANWEAQKKVEELDKLNIKQKREFIKAYCDETGFPDLSKVRKNQETEIKTALHNMGERYGFEVKFIGYDKNCSMGRTLSLPGSDCDALYMIIDDKEIKKQGESAPSMRWKFKDEVNQRLLCTHASGMPELLSVSDIEDGLKLADEAFQKANFKISDLLRFKMNMFDDSKDFAGAGEFDIKMAQELPDDKQTRDKFYKTAMVVELIREGVVLENDFSPEMTAKIKKSPLYKYSNIIRQKGLSAKTKNKHEQRKNIAEDFHKMETDEQFELIKDMIHSSLHIKDASHRGLFVNENPNGQDEMGNILVLYDRLMHATKPNSNNTNADTDTNAPDETNTGDTPDNG